MLYVIGSISAVEELVTGDMPSYSDLNGISSVVTENNCTDITEYLESQPVNIMQIATNNFSTIYTDGILDDIKNHELKFTTHVDLDRNPSSMIILAKCLSYYRSLGFGISQSTLDYCIRNAHGDWIRPFMLKWGYYTHSFLEVLCAFGIIKDYDTSNKNSIRTDNYYPAGLFSLPTSQFRLMGCDEVSHLNYAANAVKMHTQDEYLNGETVYNLCSRFKELSLTVDDVSYMRGILPEYESVINHIIYYININQISDINDIDVGIIKYGDKMNSWYLI